jgi:hypothetical protein
MGVVFSRFPARLQVDDGRLYRKAGVVVTEHRFLAAERVGSGVSVVFDRSDVSEVEKLPDRTTVVRFADGGSVRIGKGDGCSCGSPLKTWWSQQLRSLT